MEAALTTAVLFFVTIDPVGIAPIFMGLTRNMEAEERRQTARRGTLIAAIVLLVFAVAGELLLKALGIGLPAFQIAGGALLFLLAVDMVFARPSGLRSMTDTEGKEAKERHDISVFPLAVPLMAGPGAITSAMLAMGHASGDLGAQAVVLCVMLLIVGLTLASLMAAGRVMKVLGVTGTNVIGRVMGILLAALASQFLIDGIRSSGLLSA